MPAGYAGQSGRFLQIRRPGHCRQGGIPAAGVRWCYATGVSIPSLSSDFDWESVVASVEESLTEEKVFDEDCNNSKDLVHGLDASVLEFVPDLCMTSKTSLLMGCMGGDFHDLSTYQDSKLLLPYIRGAARQSELFKLQVMHPLLIFTFDPGELSYLSSLRSLLSNGADGEEGVSCSHQTVEFQRELSSSQAHHSQANGWDMADLLQLWSISKEAFAPSVAITLENDFDNKQQSGNNSNPT